MNILVLNGSPSGSESITLQTVEYLKILFPQHSYEILNVGQKIRSFEKDFSEAEAALSRAELILFCYPVYTFLVPAQLHRFIELMIVRKIRGANQPLEAFLRHDRTPVYRGYLRGSQASLCRRSVGGYGRSSHCEGTEGSGGIFQICPVEY